MCYPLCQQLNVFNFNVIFRNCLRQYFELALKIKQQCYIYIFIWSSFKFFFIAYLFFFISESVKNSSKTKNYYCFTRCTNKETSYLSKHQHLLTLFIKHNENCYFIHLVFGSIKMFALRSVYINSQHGKFGSYRTTLIHIIQKVCKK